MFRTIKTLFVLISFCFVAASCEKEYSAEYGGTNTGGSQSGTAVFTLDGASGACSLPTISGTYQAGTALTAAEKITLVVTVTTPGTYTISTAAINGITFTGSGSFATAGQTFIELTATGNTPAAAGTFNYVPGTAGCSFPITFGASSGSSSGTAVYTFDGAPDDCVTPVVAGTYTAGVALTASNTVTLLVNVTTPGTYTVSTGTANGIKFSGSGTFAATGPNIITLVGSGTPVDASVIQYTPGGNGCSFDITVTASGGGTPTGFYYKATIDGTVYNVAVTDNNGYEMGTSTAGADDVRKYSVIAPSTSPFPANMTAFSVGNGLFGDYFNITNTLFKSYYAVGAHAFKPNDSENGIVLTWYDNTGKEWTTDNAPGTQAGSAFNITSVTDYQILGNYYEIRIKCTFNCKLYDEAGASLTLTNGEFDGTVIK